MDEEEGRRERQQRQRIRDGREDERWHSPETKRKKRSATSEVRRWSKAFCGCLIVLGIIFVFYVITTLIIDGSSPLDFFPFQATDEYISTQKYPNAAERNASTLKFRSRATINARNRTTFFEKRFEDVTNVVKDDGPREDVALDPLHIAENDTFSHLRNDLMRNSTEGEIRSRDLTGEINKLNVTTTSEEESEGRSYVAYIPVPLDGDEEESEETDDYLYNEEEEENEGKRRRRKKKQKTEPSKQKPILVPVMILPDGDQFPKPGGDRGTASALRRPPTRDFHGENFNYRVFLPPLRNEYRNNHRVSYHMGGVNSKALPLPPLSPPPPPLPSAPVPPTFPLRPPPPPIAGPMGKFSTFNPHSFRQSSTSSVQRKRYLSPPRDKIPPSLRSHGITDGPNRGYLTDSQGREIFLQERDRISSPQSLRYDRHSGASLSSSNGSYRNDPRYTNRNLTNKQKYDLFRRYLARSPRRRPLARNSDYQNKPPLPPPEFRYPPTASSIQDIIAYMSGRGRTRENSVLDLTLNKDRFYRHTSNGKQLPSELIIGDQNHVLGGSPFSFVSEGEPTEIDNESGFERIPRTHLNFKTFLPPHLHDNFYSGHEYDANSSFDHRPLSPVENTYNPYGIDDNRSTSHRPLKIILDIYPATDSSSPISHLESLLSPSSDGLQRMLSNGADKQEIILHLNFYYKPPSHRSQSLHPFSARGEGMSVDIPLNGNISPLDIYKAVVAKAGRRPIASPHTGGARDISSNENDDVEIELFDVEEGPILYEAIERGLKKLNVHLPQKNKILFSDLPVTNDDLVNVGKSVDDTSSSSEDNEEHSSPWDIFAAFLDKTVQRDGGRQLKDDSVYKDQGVTSEVR